MTAPCRKRSVSLKESGHTLSYLDEPDHLNQEIEAQECPNQHRYAKLPRCAQPTII